MKCSVYFLNEDFDILNAGHITINHDKINEINIGIINYIDFYSNRQTFDDNYQSPQTKLSVDFDFKKLSLGDKLRRNYKMTHSIKIHHSFNVEIYNFYLKLTLIKSLKINWSKKQTYWHESKAPIKAIVAVTVFIAVGAITGLWEFIIKLAASLNIVPK